MEERAYWLWLTRVPGIGYQKIKALLSYRKNPKALFEMTSDELDHLFASKIFRKGDRQSFEVSRDLKSLECYTERLKSCGVRYLTRNDTDYPNILGELYEPVYVLYYRGEIRASDISIGIVGARRCTAYGRKAAEKFGRELAAQGVNVISGLARGIDSYGHKGALDVEGYTSAVLGCGINVCYPSENQLLMRRIIQNGCVFSEYGLDVEPNRGYFPLRNRIISALSDGLLLVEAKERSGSLITVDYALEYGKDIFSVPGDIFGKSCAGSNNLIRLGAKPVFEGKDILEEYSLFSHNEANCPSKKEFILEEKEEMVYSCINLSPVFIDEIIAATGISVSEIQFLLMKLEMKGAVIQLPNKHYIRDY